MPIFLSDIPRLFLSREVPLDAALQVLPLGKSELVQDGRDLLFAVGTMVAPALEAARELDLGVQVAVLIQRPDFLGVLRPQQRRRELAEIRSQIVHVARQHGLGVIVAGGVDRLWQVDDHRAVGADDVFAAGDVPWFSLITGVVAILLVVFYMMDSYYYKKELGQKSINGILEYPVRTVVKQIDIFNQADRVAQKKVKQQQVKVGNIS